MMRIPSLTALLMLTACAPTAEREKAQPAPAREYAPIDGSFVVGDARPTTVYVPSNYDPAVPMPLVVLLHSYGITGVQIDDYLGFRAFAQANGFITAHPEGTVDASGQPFWNASNACCDFDGTDVDDSAFVRAVVDDAMATANVDPARVYVMGHSNGGFMAQRMACDHADVLAAVISLAGASTLQADACQPSGPVALLEVHGTSDETIAYNGGSVGGPAYPSAPQTAALWAERNACDDTAVAADAAFDIDQIAGAETSAVSYANCAPGGAAELWTVAGGTHVPSPNASYLDTLWAFLLAHPKP